jgi:hypothetical protein
VSKSFKCDNCGEISSIMVHIPKFQIVQAGSDVHAEYLIVVGLGAVTLGVWRRFREFKTLATKLASSEKRRQFHNALCSWHCLRARQRLFRCLDKDYLILKVLLLLLLVFLLLLSLLLLLLVVFATATTAVVLLLLLLLLLLRLLVVVFVSIALSDV